MSFADIKKGDSVICIGYFCAPRIETVQRITKYLIYVDGNKYRKSDGYLEIVRRISANGRIILFSETEFSQLQKEYMHKKQRNETLSKIKSVIWEDLKQETLTGVLALVDKEKTESTE
jgi:hypothetical protein